MTDKQKQIVNKAKTADLLTYLLTNHSASLDKNPYEDSWDISGTHRRITKEHPSTTFDKTNAEGSKWDGIDTLIKCYDYTFWEAVYALAKTSPGEEDSTSTIQSSMPSAPIITVDEKKEFVIPTHGITNKHLFAYLNDVRGIPQDLIKRLISEKLLYEDEKKNLVFINAEQTALEYRGTNTDYERTHCKKYKSCSDYVCGAYESCQKHSTCSEFEPLKYRGCRSATKGDYWYFRPYPQFPRKNVYICESAIDAISLYLIIGAKEYQGMYISMAGAGKNSVIESVIRESSDKDSNIFICTDNDPAGNSVIERYPDLSRIKPFHKDWNDDWKDMEQVAKNIEYRQQFNHLFE